MKSLSFTKRDSSETYSLDLYDTRGFMDDDLSFKEMSPDWIKVVKDRVTEIHYVVFVLRGESRAANTMAKELQSMS